MPGRTPKEAADAFVMFLRETLSCLSPHYVTAFQQSEKLYKVYYEPYANVSGADTDYQVSITQIFRTIPTEQDRKVFKAKTQEYSYSLLSREGQEVVSYHWHPNDPGVKYPHLHIHEPTIKHIHFPTSRVCLEDFIFMLFRDYKIRPNLSQTECKQILQKNKSSFEKWATWKIQHQ